MLELKRGETRTPYIMPTPITTTQEPPKPAPAPAVETLPAVISETRPAIRQPSEVGFARRISRTAAYNCLILDEIDGKQLGWIEAEQPDKTCIDLGRLWRYHRYQVHFVKRWKDGKIEVIRRPDKLGEVTPAMAGDALEDTVSGKLFAPEQTFWDKLNDFKIPILIIVMTIAIFFLAFTFAPGGK